MATQQVINVGTLPNDGEGDPLRVAFQKVNNNFSNLFSTNFSTVTTVTTGLTPNQVIFEYDANTFTQSTITVRSYNPNTIDMQNLNFSAAITNNMTGVKYTAYGISTEGNALCSYSMDVFSGNVRLMVTPVINTAITHYVVYQVTDGNI